jgi:hypothetical protein
MQNAVRDGHGSLVACRKTRPRDSGISPESENPSEMVAPVAIDAAVGIAASTVEAALPGIVLGIATIWAPANWAALIRFCGAQFEARSKSETRPAR